MEGESHTPVANIPSLWWTILQSAPDNNQVERRGEKNEIHKCESGSGTDEGESDELKCRAEAFDRSLLTFVWGAFHVFFASASDRPGWWEPAALKKITAREKEKGKNQRRPADEKRRKWATETRISWPFTDFNHSGSSGVYQVVSGIPFLLRIKQIDLSNFFFFCLLAAVHRRGLSAS